MASVVYPILTKLYTGVQNQLIYLGKFHISEFKVKVTITTNRMLLSSLSWPYFLIPFCLQKSRYLGMFCHTWWTSCKNWMKLCLWPWPLNITRPQSAHLQTQVYHVSKHEWNLCNDIWARMRTKLGLKYKKGKQEKQKKEKRGRIIHAWICGILTLIPYSEGRYNLFHFYLL